MAWSSSATTFTWRPRATRRVEGHARRHAASRLRIAFATPEELAQAVFLLMSLNVDLEPQAEATRKVDGRSPREQGGHHMKSTQGQSRGDHGRSIRHRSCDRTASGQARLSSLAVGRGRTRPRGDRGELSQARREGHRDAVDVSSREAASTRGPTRRCANTDP